MKIFTAKQIREGDNYTIKHEPISSIDLMERAASRCFEWIISHYKQDNNFIVFAGPGNNGGDGLAIARKLAIKSFNVTVYLLKTSDTLSQDCRINYKRLKDQNIIRIHEIKTEKDIKPISENYIIIDALFGSGLSRPLTDVQAKLVEQINNSKAEVISIDIPSGLFSEDNSILNNYSKTKPVVNATHTLTFEFPKLSFFFSENSIHIGIWHIIQIGIHSTFIEKTETPFYYNDKADITTQLKKRDRFSHKGTFGHALLIAGSYGMMGAAILSAKACIRTGAGLVTAHVPKKGCDIMQISSPETIVSIDSSEDYFSELPDINSYSSVGIGPGIQRNKETMKALQRLLQTIHVPLVIDADALNIISENKDMLSMLPMNSILTPHPKEFTRLTEMTYSGFERIKVLITFAKKYHVYVVLKGAHTAIACPDGRCYFNSTGNPGMATGGSGDVLTGMITSLLAQGYTPKQAAMIGVFLHGSAGDIAACSTGQEALTASDIIENIGKGFVSRKS